MRIEEKTRIDTVEFEVNGVTPIARVDVCSEDDEVLKGTLFAFFLMIHHICAHDVEGAIMVTDRWCV